MVLNLCRQLCADVVDVVVGRFWFLEAREKGKPMILLLANKNSKLHQIKEVASTLFHASWREQTNSWNS